MKTLSAEIAQQYGVYEDWKDTRTKNKKIQCDKLKKGRKLLKKGKLPKKIESKELIFGTQIEILNKNQKNHFTERQKIENDKKVQKQNGKIDSFNEISTLSDLYQKVSEFLSPDICTPQIISYKSDKSMKKSSLQNLSKNELISFNELLKKIKDEPEIKVLDLLQNKEILLFKGIKPEDIKNCQNEAEKFLLSGRFLNNLQSHKFGSQKFQQKITVNLRQVSSQKSTLIQVKKNFSTQLIQLVDNSQTLTFCQSEFIKQQQKFQSLWQTQIRHKLNQSQKLKEIAKILIVLLKCYKENNLKTKKIYDQIIKREQLSSKQEKNSVSKQRSNLFTNEEFYTKCLIKKCLIKTFSFEQTLIKSKRQLWNFFKLNHHNEQMIINEGFYDPESYRWIQSQQEYKDYISRIMNRKILFKPILHTNCKACFSNHVEKSNLMVKCPSCKFKIHQRCGKIDDKCDRCNYKKLKTSLKLHARKCFICHNETKSLMLYKIKGPMFAHNFCLLVHNLWTVESNRLSFDFEKYRLLKVHSKSQNKPKSQNSSQMIDQTLEKAQAKNKQLKTKDSFGENCTFCRKSSQIQKQFLNKCQNCDQQFHTLCAYLNGCKISITSWSQNFSVNLKFQCCTSQQFMKKEFEENRKNLEMSRKYKLNYENFAINYDFQNANFHIDDSEYVTNRDRKLTTSSIEPEN